jgi:hypothetical protein
MAGQEVERVEAEEVTTPSLRTRRTRLGTVDDVRLELARVYRDMRNRRISMADGTKLAYVLGLLAKVTETSLLEQRLFELEDQLRKLRN